MYSPGPWIYPESRYYYEWYSGLQPQRADFDIKRDVLGRLRSGPYHDQYDVDVTVEKGVVILTGTTSSGVAKRAAGDDAWDTRGVSDVSNQLEVRQTASAQL